MRVRSQPAEVASAADALLATATKKGSDTEPAPAIPVMEMGFATMAAQLTNGGHLDVRLGNVAQWSPENRAQALSWIRAGFAKDSRPVFLDAYLKPFATRAEVPGKVDAPPAPLHGFMDAIPQEIKNLAAYIP